MISKTLHLLAAILLALMLAACSIPGSLEKTDAIRQLEVEAKSGEPESQYRLGLHYTLNSEWLVDHIRGYRWFLSAAKQGHAGSQYMVGFAKLNARGTFYDFEGSVDYFRMAALQGHARAQFRLGQAYLNGKGCPKDKFWGRQWLEQAAWNGHKDAQFLLAALFSKGVGGQVSLAEAWRWLKRAQGNKHSLADPALKNLQKRMSAEEVSLGKRLLTQLPPEEAIYLLPRIRYVQAMLNMLGYSAGEEDGKVGPQTLAAISAYRQDKKVPRDTQPLGLVEYLRGSQ